MTEHEPAPPRQPGSDGEAPDPRLLWRWAGDAVRPWAGWAFMALGGLLVLLGYLGVSRESIVEKQVPFLISGGIGGILLCVVGAYFLAAEQLRRDSGRLDRLELLVEELHEALLTRPDAPTSGRLAPPNGRSPRAKASFVAVQGGETYHGAGCAMAEGKSVESLTTAQATERGLRPCPLCEPIDSGHS